MKKGAEFSKDKKYRYSLWRIWDESLPIVMCIGLNPSRADADNNDATINILIRILNRLGYGGFYMVNLYAWITPYPNELFSCKDPLRDNDEKILQVYFKKCLDVIFCWGNFNKIDDWRIQLMIERFPKAKCFGYNRNRSPLHPRGLTYIKNGLETVKLIQYEVL